MRVVAWHESACPLAMLGRWTERAKLVRQGRQYRQPRQFGNLADRKLDDFVHW